MAKEKLDLRLLLETMFEKKATDLHLSAGASPAFRIESKIIKSQLPPLTPEEVKALAYSVVNEGQRKKFQEQQELDFAFTVHGRIRIRANYFIQKGAVAAVFRRIPSDLPVLEKLGYSTSIDHLIERPNGLILVTGATGSGKTTTLAAFIDLINQRYPYHVITVEDPIEYVHTHKQSIVNQREVGTDVGSFALALRQSLREDPDVIMVGEIRDAETADAALRAAETGHLVFSTLHTNGAINSIHRLVQMFNIEQQDYIRSLLSHTLECVLSQALIPKIQGGVALVYEYLAMTSAIRHLIRENKLHQIYGQMQMGQNETGMSTLNQSLARLVLNGTVTIENALQHSPDPEELVKKCGTPNRRSA